MERSGHEEVKIFIGEELESSVAKGLPTLFVVGAQPRELIVYNLKKYDHVSHVYLAANKSFSVNNLDYYIGLIRELTAKKVYVTVDYPASEYVTCFHAFKEFHNNSFFVPMINVEMPNFHKMPNVAVRIDDIDFNKTNPGVWVLRHETIAGPDFFTPWSDYDSDIIIN